MANTSLKIKLSCEKIHYPQKKRKAQVLHALVLGKENKRGWDHHVRSCNESFLN